MNGIIQWSLIKLEGIEPTTIKELATLQDQLRWRSVEEELPEQTNAYLVHLHNYSKCYQVSYIIGYGWRISSEYEVTHWLPIPRKEEQ